ncbi:MAG: hypothetical protein DI569_01330 [Sphingopyxis macrogoltabida]|uniref:Uncharacterized protein n=1 Tax=Sphingopyxis macrogoltabida TaxID=33050 RepID=A0A2W5L560_SPHMC|nr:MAG: hypothetical protein DI569_01330 [Sphingopyxis macrogoltabida]
MIYALFRPVAGIVTTGVHIWDAHGSEPATTLYSNVGTHLPIPADADPTNYRLANGMRCERIEPLHAFRIGFEDGDRIGIDLHFTGVHPPHVTGGEPVEGVALASWWGDERKGHFDQPMRVTGELRLWGETLTVDCCSIRDRSWSIRSEQGDDWPPMGYAYATLGGDAGFNTMSRAMGSDSEDDQSVVAGYMVQAGTIATLMRGRRLVFERQDGRPKHIRIELEDTLGRRMTAQGECFNSLAFLGNTTTLLWWSLTRWTLDDGTVIWGEDGESWWPAATWTAFRRQLAASQQARDE